MHILLPESFTGDTAFVDAFYELPLDQDIDEEQRDDGEHSRRHLDALVELGLDALGIHDRIHTGEGVTETLESQGKGDEALAEIGVGQGVSFQFQTRRR